MGSSNHQPVDVDPQTLSNARSLWHNFTTMTKYGVIAVMVLLLGMAYFLA